jgi:hypothetical protein
MNANALVGTHDVLMIVFDTLRFDVADRLYREGKTPVLEAVLPPGGWEQRHTPGNFTFAAHQAFFAGFFPTPARPGKHPRLFATRFPGSETSTGDTCVFDAPNVIEGFRGRGYRTVCIGGVGFFNPNHPLGTVLPALFDEAHWSAKTSTTEVHSTREQVAIAARVVSELPPSRRVFLFVNVSALHQPNCHYVAGAKEDSLETHAAALRYVDGELAPLFDLMRARAPTLAILGSDHGTAYGEDGFVGHRCAHPVVWNVPWAEVVL